MKTKTMEQALQALKKYFGYESFRPLQADIISHIMQGKDALVLMPTGGGKSVCYQIPAIIMPGTCVVVSPLISLMKDQVDGLLANGVRASFLNSTQSSQEQNHIEQSFYKGELDLLYVSPEKLVSSGFLPLLRNSPVSMFAVDEAHCISAWGHDFRPEYTQMKFIKREFPNAPVVALTATADRVTRNDIIQQLDLLQPAQFIASFDRPNISLEVRPGQKRLEQILAFLKKHPNQSGIIYCLSRKNTEELALKLNEKGYKTAFYHAGMSDDARSRVQDDFIHDRTPIICATIAFGMGIDKSNVRWIIHYNLPKNIEGYYQEIGRSGRDGAPADTLLFYSYQDYTVLEDIIRKPENENQEVQLAKLERMKQYAETLVCRRRTLLNYFNETYTENCGNCDICRNPPEYFDGTLIAQKALSAIYRLREKVGISLLIDVLRGSSRKEIYELGYDQIKTYGAGRDYSVAEWQHHLQHMLSAGYIEIAHDEHHVIKLTSVSHLVLFENAKVELVRMKTWRERQEEEKEKTKVIIQTKQPADRDLFDVLRQVRLQLAREKGVPPYLIFNDATLEEMSALKPLNEMEMLRVSGVGEFKLREFGGEFITAILGFLGQKGQTPKGTTFQITLELFRSGMEPEQIAQNRGIHLNTVYSHFVHELEKGEELDLNRLVDAYEQKAVLDAIATLEPPYKLKSLFELLDESVDYNKIKLVLTAFLKQQS